MTRYVAFISMFMALAMPALAFEIEEIGSIKADFDGEAITQPTVLAKQEGKASATAFLFLPGGGMSGLSLAGYSRDNKRLGLEVSYMTERPDPQTVPIDLTITYAPKGTKEHWTSEDAPTPVEITFTTLETKGEEGRAIGTFKAILCYAENYDSGSDTGNCRPIEGRFETKIFIEE